MKQPKSTEHPPQTPAPETPPKSDPSAEPPPPPRKLKPLDAIAVDALDPKYVVGAGEGRQPSRRLRHNQTAFSWT